MTYPNEIRLFYPANVRPDLLGLDKSLSGIVDPIASKPKTLLEVDMYGRNLNWAPYRGEAPVQLQVSHMYGKKHRGRGISLEEVYRSDALYALARRCRRSDGTVVEVFYLESFKEPTLDEWYYGLSPFGEEILGDPL